MPGSYDFFDKSVQMFVDTVLPKGAILDIGPGAGKFGKLLSSPDRPVDGVEVFGPYVDRYRLREIYRRVVVEDVRNFRCGFREYDLVILGDILEHLTVEDAQAVLAYFEEQGISTIVLVPYNYEQGPSHGNDHEEHLQPDLTEEVFHARYPGFRKLFGNHYQGVFFKPAQK